MREKAVVWDIDDVLTPTSLTFYQSALKTHGECPHPDHWSDYLWGKHIRMDEGLETQQYLIEHRIIETSEPYEYTEQALATTKAHGYKNILLSARAWHPNPAHATREWAARYVLDPLIDDMHFVQVEEPKSVVLARLMEQYQIKAFVEDNPFHAKGTPALIPQIYLVRRGWNTECLTHPTLRCVDTALEAAQQIVLATI